MLFLKGWGFDWFYNISFINFYLYISKNLSSDPFNRIINYFLKIIQIFNFYLLKTSNGYVRWYVASMILGINFIFLLILLL